MDGRTDVRTDGKPDPFIAPYLRQARQKPNSMLKRALWPTFILRSNSCHIHSLSKAYMFINIKFLKEKCEITGA